VKKWMIISSAVVIFVLVVYGWGWIQSYTMSERYFQQANANMKAGNYAIALKGTPSTNGDTDYQGGYEQVVNMWSGPWSFPRPSIYWEAEHQIQDIIQNKLTISDAQDIIQTYLNLDNEYLPEIMLQIGDESLKNGDIDTAREAYNQVIQVFGEDTNAVKAATEQLKKLGKH
jgi:tetratricopeptide (TPR) repeat protein